MSSVALFSQAADSFVDLVGRIPASRWGEPGLGSWSVRDLVGHTTRALLTVTTYLGHDEPSDVTVPTAEHYYAVALTQFGDDASVAARGVEAGRWLGEDPVAKIRQALEEARAALAAQPSNRVVSIGGMGIPLAEYLRTRVFEITVHTIDLARATGLPHGLPAAVMSEAASLSARTAVARGHGDELLLALTGRQPLPENFSVV